MNFLAHALLSQKDRDVRVGNLTADWIKGRARRALPAAVQVGFQLHHEIDAFTDLHPATAVCTALLAPRWDRYAGILVDVFFDHILAADWTGYCDTPLPRFTRRVYDDLLAAREFLPASVHFPIYAMIADDWLTAYATLDGIRLALTRMSARLHGRGHTVELAPAADDLHEHLGHFHHHFAALYADLRRRVATPRPQWRAAS